MVYINEWLPNPAGRDSAVCPDPTGHQTPRCGEWIELYNSGEARVALKNWELHTKSGRKFVFSEEQIGPYGYLVLPRNKTHLVLRNSDEALVLYDSSGTRVHHSEFYGEAREGMSFARFEDRFLFSKPTPGAPNLKTESALLIQYAHPFGRPLSAPVGGVEIAFLSLAAGVAFASIALFMIKKNDDLSELFFGRNKEIR